MNHHLISIVDLLFYINSFYFAETNVATMVEVEKNEFVMCTLNKTHTMQQPVDLNFMKGTEVAFFTQGKGSVHLTGFLIPDEDAFGDYEGEEEESSDGWLILKLNASTYWFALLM